MLCVQLHKNVKIVKAMIRVAVIMAQNGLLKFLVQCGFLQTHGVIVLIKKHVNDTI